jgi:hypothetical protein
VSTVDIGDNVLCLGIVVVAGIVLAICAWRGNWPN